MNTFHGRSGTPDHEKLIARHSRNNRVRLTTTTARARPGLPLQGTIASDPEFAEYLAWLAIVPGTYAPASNS